MAESSHTTARNRVSIILVLIANLLLFFALLNARANRIAFANVSFFSGEFIGLLVGAGLCMLVSSWASLNGAFHHRLQKRPWIALLLIALLCGVWVIPRVVPAFEAYSAPFILWAMVLILAIVQLMLAPILNKIDFLPIFKTVAQSAIGLLILFAIVEGSLRLWFTFLGSETDKANYLYDFNDVLTKYNRFTGEPYVNFGLSPEHPDHNSRGYRGDELIKPKPADTFRIFAIGGSTTYGVSLKNSETYPATLQAILHERGYTNVEVINAGVPQYATYDNLINFELRILDDQPDMILTYEGINDVVTRLVDPQAYTGLNAMRGIWNTANVPQSPFVAVRFFGQRLGLMTPPSSLDSVLFNVGEVQRCTNPTFCDNLGLSPQAVLEQNPPTYFERNLRNLVAIAKANEVAVVFSTWAYFPEPSNGSLYMTYPYMQFGVAQHNEITRTLGQALDIPLIDLAESMPYGAQYWLDGLHMTPEGTRAQATLYADFLIDNQLLPKP